RGGGVYSLNGGSFTMSGGVVGGVIEGYGNNAHYGGGIAINVGAIFAMTDTARVSYNNASSNGGGVYQYGGNIEMNNGEIAYNKATENGGGVWRNAGGFDASIDCKIHNNTANRYGGGIYATAFGAVSFNATIYSNEALDGGGIYIQARGVIYKIDGSISITENIATRNGGGIFINAGILEILNNAVISGNIAGSDGGGIYSNTSGSLSLTGGRILSNTAGNDGGGIYIAVGTSNLIAGTEISSNTASGGGGGVYCNSTCTMNAGSILSNTAENGGGIYNAGTFSLSTSGSAVIASNIAHENGGGVYNAGILNMFGSVVGGLSATEANTAKNGAGIYNTATFTMSAGAVIGNNATDYGGGVFIAGTSATLNMTGGIISENIAASGGGLYNMDGTLSISKTGTVSPQITYNIAYNQGGGVYSYGDDSVIDMSDGSISYNQAKLGGGVLFMRGQFLMTGGQISTNEAQFGAGVFCDGSFTLKDGIIELNTVTDDGGGVYVYIGGVLSMEDGQIVNNQATGVGGGVCIARIDYSGGTFEMLGGQIGANSANLGGGVFNDGSFIMSGGIISANTALSDGGGVFLTGSGSFEISGTSKISNNIAIRNGGGIFIPYEFLNSLTVGAGVTFFNNTAVASYERSPLDDAMYFANILCPDWSDSLTQGYNNFDISYISCTITFNGNGGVVSPSDTTRLVPQVSKLTSYMPANPIRIGYVFYSWNTLSNGTGTIFTGDTIVDTDITVYAQWTAIPYTVTYNGNGNTSGSVPASPATYSYNDTVIVLGNTGNFAKTGYTFIGWSTNPTAVASTYSPGYAFPIQSNITLYAVWQESGKYTVTVNGSYAATTGTGSYGQGANVTINAGTRDGYTFSGWTVTVGGVTLASASSATTTFTMPANDVTVTANWTQVLYTVTVNGSYAATTGAGSYGQGTNVTINAGTRDGYTFSGWTVTTGGVTLASAGIATTTFTMPANNVTVTANWTQNPAPTTYTVTYNGNGNSGGSVPVDSASPYNAGSTVTVIGNTGNLVKTGYTFLGWSTNQSATTAQYTAGSTFIINSNTTLYAVWQAETEATYRVTYVGGGDTRGVAPIDPNSYHAGDKATVLGAGNLVRSNYAFLGWSTSASATTVEYKADDSITVNGNITLYAVWESESASPPWALLNLILAITGALVAIGTLVYAFARKNKNTKMLWLIVSIVLGIAGLIVFFLTEKTGNPMVFMDWWTIVNAVILVLGVIGVKFAFKRKEETSRRNAR
ncbi:MAG: InlB B-repeat-containing protein, partial [Dehalococcoidia bacterium]|nr:InlB B-repeat-containing protein [Dehalococcoidia bacterium]